MISQKTIDAVQALDIETILKPYVKLSRRGSTLMGCCPFHNERDPSFAVSNGMYYCHSCQKGGNAVGFVMEKEGLSWIQAIEEIAKQNNIPIERIESKLSDEERAKQQERQEILAAIDAVQTFFRDNLRLGVSEDARQAREYAYNRWGEELCAKWGVGYASDSQDFRTWYKSKGFSDELLLKAGILNRPQDRDYTYPVFQRRVTIPVYNSARRIIAYTARTLNPEEPAKYVNSPNTKLFVKSDNLFGINIMARGAKSSPYVIVVEGAPDAMKLHQLGLESAIALMGTSMSDKQLDTLKRYTSALCFIPDADVPKDRVRMPAGVGAVIRNGTNAMRKGFEVTVRELPFHSEPRFRPKTLKEKMADRENLLVEKKMEAKASGMSRKEWTVLSLTEDEIASIPDTIEDGVELSKNDADSYLQTKEMFFDLEEKHFVVWLAEKRFYLAHSLAAKRNVVREVADLLRFIKDKTILDECIEALSQIEGKTKLWRDALSRARAEAVKSKEAKRTERDKEAEKIERLRQCNLTIIDHCFHSYDDEGEPIRLSNFEMELLYHIMDEVNGVRIFSITNKYNETKKIEFRESELCSLTTFQQRVGSIGNYIWRAKIDKLNNVKEYLYRQTESAERVKKLGWDITREFYAFGNGIWYDGEFYPVDDLGIVKLPTNAVYYIPAKSKMYENNLEIYQFERSFVHENRSGLKLHDFASQLIKVFGDNAMVAIGYLLASLFRDVVFKRAHHFPILNLFGEKGTGKTTLATCLQSFFQKVIDPPNLGVTSIPAMNDKMSDAVNSLIVLDEYKNDLDARKIAFLKGLWGGGGQTKKNVNTDGKASQTFISATLALCGQDKPTQDMALFTRVLFLAFHKTSFTKAERDAYDDLVALCNLGNTHLTLELLNHRELFERNFSSVYGAIKAELSKMLENEKIHDRIFGNWIIPLAAFRTLESVIEMPFSYSDLLQVVIRCMRLQNETSQESSEMGDFWDALQGFHTQGRAIDKAHFRIKWHRSFRSTTMKEEMVFAEPTPILYLNRAAVAGLFNGRSSSNATSNRSNWSTILSYLNSHPSCLGLKQDRFIILLANGTPDYNYESVNGSQIKKLKVNRPKALCFNYAMLKQEFGLNLETEVISESDDLGEDPELDTDSSYQNQPHSPKSISPSQPSIFDTQNRKDELPF